jgi:hypothetical protein
MDRLAIHVIVSMTFGINFGCFHRPKSRILLNKIASKLSTNRRYPYSALTWRAQTCSSLGADDRDLCKDGGPSEAPHGHEAHRQQGVCHSLPHFPLKITMVAKRHDIATICIVHH